MWQFQACNFTGLTGSPFVTCCLLARKVWELLWVYIPQSKERTYCINPKCQISFTSSWLALAGVWLCQGTFLPVPVMLYWRQSGRRQESRAMKTYSAGAVAPAPSVGDAWLWVVPSTPPPCAAARAFSWRDLHSPPFPSAHPSVAARWASCALSEPVPKWKLAGRFL